MKKEINSFDDANEVIEELEKRHFNVEFWRVNNRHCCAIIKIGSIYRKYGESNDKLSAFKKAYEKMTEEAPKIIKKVGLFQKFINFIDDVHFKYFY